MTSLYPLRFPPLFRRYLWGDRRLESNLGKTLPPGTDYAESWEVVDHGPDQSCVAQGPLQGMTLAELLATAPRELLGHDLAKCMPIRPSSESAVAAKSKLRPTFPLLLKFLDAQQNLSVQVHPDDVRAARRIPPDLGKTEAWVILDAAPGAVVYAGLKRGFDRPALEREVRRGTTQLCLHKWTPQPGDCLFIPAGTVHALGAGLLVAEIQQSSDTTYRLYDWDRVGPDGKPRPLHIDEALEAIDYQAGPVAPQTPRPTDRPFVEQLVACAQFVLERWTIADAVDLGGDGKFRLATVLQGAVEVAGDAARAPLRRGQSMLFPASLGPTRLLPVERTVLLVARLP